MLHHYYTNFALGETELILQVDNCVWQIKNFTLMCYLNYRILKNWNTNIEIHYMPLGHTRFSVDWAFGLFKQHFRRSDAFTLEQLKDIVDGSTPNSHVNHGILVSDERGTNLKIQFLKWSNYFENLKWTKIPDLTKYYHFKFKSSSLGYVWCRTELKDKPIWIPIGFNINADIQLEEETPPGLPFDRHLFEKLREYCPDEYKNVLCPAPVNIPAEEISTTPEAGSS